MMDKNIKIVVGKDYEEVSAAAAQTIAQTVRNKPNAVIGFATGSTPIGAYKELIRMHNEEGLDFSGITTFNLDEYYPIKRDNDQSYYYFMFDNLFGHINVRKENVNILNGEAADWEKEAEDYEARIERAGGVDLQILGIGVNGHIAFIEPGDTFKKYTSLADLSVDTIKANSRFFEKEEDVPKQALSMGVRTIMASKKIILIATGKGKAEAVKKAVYGEITPSVPASVLQLHQDVTFFVDNDVIK